MNAILKINILSHWRAGTGQERPGALDATCQRDQDGLPIIPGKHLKGLMRDAMRRAYLFGWTGDLDEQMLFGGTASRTGETGLSDVAPGKIRVSSAYLPDPERAAFQNEPALIATLFETRRSTAINQSGTATPGSLRFEEVAVPMRLEAKLTAQSGAPDNWQDKLGYALSLLRAVGAQRTRGLGRCVLELDQVKQS